MRNSALKRARRAAGGMRWRRGGRAVWVGNGWEVQGWDWDWKGYTRDSAIARSDSLGGVWGVWGLG